MPEQKCGKTETKLKGKRSHVCSGYYELIPRRVILTPQFLGASMTLDMLRQCGTEVCADCPIKSTD